jgi:hypothetical protein
MMIQLLLLLIVIGPSLAIWLADESCDIREWHYMYLFQAVVHSYEVVYYERLYR